VRFSEWRDRETAVLFWSPGCGFCQKMLPELLRWEESAPKGSPALLVVSNGSPESNRALGIRSPLVLDHNGDVKRQFRAAGTPNAVLIDRNGSIASPVVRGAAPFWDLVGGAPKH
jgi:thiol-disulfide isomerase/thioredoxin